MSGAGQLCRLLTDVLLISTALRAQTVPISEYAVRRAALGALAGDGAVVVIGAAEPLYDHEYFSQSPHLARKHPDAVPTEGNRLVLQLRGQKSAAEIALLNTSIGITVRAHEEVMRMLAPGWNEFEVQALVEYTYRRNGADRPGFTTIAGSGDNATTLHYWRNDRAIQAGELMVLDIGASGRRAIARPDRAGVDRVRRLTRRAIVPFWRKLAARWRSSPASVCASKTTTS